MMNIDPVNIKILTIPRQIYRNFMTLGHLETIGFPVMKMIKSGHLKFYNGFDINSYTSAYSLGNAIVRSGYKQGEQLLRDDKKENPVNPAHVIEFGFLNILSLIRSEGVPALVFENDVFFTNMKSLDIVTQLNILVKTVGLDNIKVAMLFFKDKGLQTQRVTDFWGRGMKGTGQIANFITPVGAEFLLNRPKLNPTLENYLRRYPNTDGFYTALENQCIHSNYAQRVQNLYENYIPVEVL